MKKIYPFIVVCAVIVVLQLGLQYAQVPSYLFPLPTDILKVFWTDWQFLFDALLITSFEWIVGIICAIFLGVGVAILSARFVILNKIFSPLLLISQSVPYLVFVPLLLLWFGLGFSSKIILVVLTCMFPIALVLKNDLTSAKKEYEVIVKILHLSPLRALYHVYFPASLSGFFNALKVSVSYAFGSTVVAELMGGEGGLGIFLLRAQYTYRIDRVIAVAVLVVIISLLSSAFVNWCASKIVFWNKAKK